MTLGRLPTHITGRALPSSARAAFHSASGNSGSERHGAEGADVVSNESSDGESEDSGSDACFSDIISNIDVEEADDDAFDDMLFSERDMMAIEVGAAGPSTATFEEGEPSVQAPVPSSAAPDTDLPAETTPFPAPAPPPPLVAAPTAELCSYELKRLANIERNKEVLRQLGLVDEPLITAPARPKRRREPAPPPPSSRTLRPRSAGDFAAPRMAQSTGGNLAESASVSDISEGGDHSASVSGAVWPKSSLTLAPAPTHTLSALTHEPAA